MKIYKVGDTSRAICSECEKVQTTTFKLRDVPLEGSECIVQSIMVGVCDVCDMTVVIPAQSTPAIKAAIKSSLDLTK